MPEEKEPPIRPPEHSEQTTSGEKKFILPVTRREFLKGCAISALAVAVGGELAIEAGKSVNLDPLVGVPRYVPLPHEINLFGEAPIVQSAVRSTWLHSSMWYSRGDYAGEGRHPNAKDTFNWIGYIPDEQFIGASSVSYNRGSGEQVISIINTEYYDEALQKDKGRALLVTGTPEEMYTGKAETVDVTETLESMGATVDGDFIYGIDSIGLNYFCIPLFDKQSDSRAGHVIIKIGPEGDITEIADFPASAKLVCRDGALYYHNEAKRVVELFNPALGKFFPVVRQKDIDRMGITSIDLQGKETPMTLDQLLSDCDSLLNGTLLVVGGNKHDRRNSFTISKKVENEGTASAYVFTVNRFDEPIYEYVLPWQKEQVPAIRTKIVKFDTTRYPEAIPGAKVELTLSNISIVPPAFPRYGGKKLTSLDKAPNSEVATVNFTAMPSYLFPEAGIVLSRKWVSYYQEPVPNPAPPYDVIQT